MTIAEILWLVLAGLISGALGGMLGIGGSIIMIPVLTVFLRQNIQLAQAAAMIVNVFVALPATIQHARAGAVDWTGVVRMLPLAIVCIALGVVSGNAMNEHILEAVFGAFLLYIVAHTLQRVIQRRPDSDAAMARRGWWRLSFIGGLVGYAAGLLGIGGGTLTVPLLMRIARFPLRRAIATSAAVMCITAAAGALLKNLTLSQHGDPALTFEASFILAGCLAPSAFLGGLLGAKLTHLLPINIVRIVFACLLALVGVRMILAAVNGM